MTAATIAGRARPIEGAVKVVATGVDGRRISYLDALCRVGEHLASHVRPDPGTRIVAIGRDGGHMARDATTVWGPGDVTGIYFDSDSPQPVSIGELPPAGVPVAIFAPVVLDSVGVGAVMAYLGRDGQAPVLLLAAQVLPSARFSLRRTHRDLQVITPDLLEPLPPGSRHNGWTRQ